MLKFNEQSQFIIRVYLNLNDVFYDENFLNYFGGLLRLGAGEGRMGTATAAASRTRANRVVQETTLHGNSGLGLQWTSRSQTTETE